MGPRKGKGGGSSTSMMCDIHVRGGTDPPRKRRRLAQQVAGFLTRILLPDFGLSIGGATIEVHGRKGGS